MVKEGRQVLVWKVILPVSWKDGNVFYKPQNVLKRRTDASFRNTWPFTVKFSVAPVSRKHQCTSLLWFQSVAWEEKCMKGSKTDLPFCAVFSIFISERIWKGSLRRVMMCSQDWIFELTLSLSPAHLSPPPAPNQISVRPNFAASVFANGADQKLFPENQMLPFGASLLIPSFLKILSLLFLIYTTFASHLKLFLGKKKAE